MQRSAYIAATLLTLTFSTKSSGQDIRILGPTTPEPANIDELRAASKVEKLDPCKLPALENTHGWVKSFGPDEFLEIALPSDWNRENADTAAGLFSRDRSVTFRGPDRDRITIDRKTYSLVGLPYIMNATGVVKPEIQCEVVAGSAGAFLSFYGPAMGQSGRIYYAVQGVGVTPQGKQYKISLVAYSRSYLDTLATIATNAILGGRSNK